ncbi:MAG: nucleoside deaminase [Spiribacter salinus]|uniref:Nucleoside deaminase n=1 Tax=Spiribacter salinus TaxID=1335746 RepID=A0A540VRD3_9GAMM|nr:MAG: nucleoside deaminase [Spiribacter salinus]
MSYNDTFMRRALEISAQALDQPGLEPFGAVVVQDGKIVGEGINRSLANLDPTSHGETEAIRDAARSLGTLDLRGCELYTSCEPCALCVAAMGIAGIARLYYAANMAQAGAALGHLPDTARFPIDVDHLSHECANAVGDRKMPSQQARGNEAAEILHRWAAQAKQLSPASSDAGGQ